MLYQTANAPGVLKDTWVWYEDGTYYLYNMMMPRKGVYLSTSADGVHFQEQDLVITGDDQIGSGMIWKGVNFDTDGKYYMSFTQHEHLYLVTKLAESVDLRTWNRLGPGAEFRPDAQWYKVGPFDHRPSYLGPRWDDMQTIPDERGGLYGFLTATPRNRSGFGLGRSSDGRHWRALPPPEIEWTEHDVLPWMEVAGVCSVQDRYYLAVKSNTRSEFMEQYRTAYNLPTPDPMPEISGIWILTADRPEGPWQAAPSNARLLTFDARYAHTSFCGFFNGPDGLMFNHEVKYRENGDNLGNQHLAPFKRIRVRADGSMLLCYWQGNEALKQGMPSEIELTDQSNGPAMLTQPLDIAAGAVIEGGLTFDDVSERICGVFIRGPNQTGWAIMVSRDGSIECGDMAESSWKLIDPEPVIERTLSFPEQAPFRLMIRDRFVEFYVDDVLIQAYSTDDCPTGQIGIFGTNKSDVNVWAMEHGQNP